MNGNANHNPGLEVSCKVLCCLNNVPSVRFSNWIKKKNGSVEPSEPMWSGLRSANLAAVQSQD